jgi:actin-related protein 8
MADATSNPPAEGSVSKATTPPVSDTPAGTTAPATPAGAATPATASPSKTARGTPEPSSDKQQGLSAIDACFEASKLPLDVAIFNSARAQDSDDKIRKYLQSVLVVGGTSLIPGMAHALESRCVMFLLFIFH